MRRLGFLILSAATIVTVGAAYTAALRDRAALPIERARPAFAGLAAHLGDLAWLRVAHGTSALDFAAIDNAWTVVEKGNYPAAAERVRRLLHGLAELMLVVPKTRRPALFGRLGLDAPPRGAATKVDLQDRMGRTVAALFVGRAGSDPGGGEVYVRLPGDDQTWLARGALDVSGDAVDWLDRAILDIPPARIAAIELADGTGVRLMLRRSARDGAFAAANRPAGTKFSAAATAELAGALADLRLDDVKPAAELPVPNSGVAAMRFATFDGLRVDLRLFRVADRDWLALEAAGSRTAVGEAARLNGRLVRWVYAIPVARAQSLRAGSAKLLGPPEGARSGR